MRRSPPARGLHLLPPLGELLAALLLGVQLLHDLRELRVEITHIGIPVGLHDLHGSRGRRPWGATVEVPLYRGLHVGVTEGEGLFAWREDNESDLRAAQGAELARLLEEPSPALREGHLQVALVAHFLHLDLLATLAPRPCNRQALARARVRVWVGA